MSAAAPFDLASQESAARRADLRQHPRVICVDGGVLKLAVRPEFRGRLALMLDISAGGIGLVLQEPLDPGTVLVFELRDEGGLEAIGRLARVRHCRPHPTPADAPWLPPAPLVSRLFRTMFRLQTPAEAPAWFAGCEFDRPLSDAEMQQVHRRLQAAFPEERGR